MTLRLWHQGVFLRSRTAFLKQTSGQTGEKAAARDREHREAEAKSRADPLPKKQQSANQAGRKEDKAFLARPDSTLTATKRVNEDGLSDAVVAPPSVLVLASARCGRQAAIVFPRVL
jgi:hypothetical protein